MEAGREGVSGGGEACLKEITEGSWVTWRGGGGGGGGGFKPRFRSIKRTA